MASSDVRKTVVIERIIEFADLGERDGLDAVQAGQLGTLRSALARAIFVDPTNIYEPQLALHNFYKGLGEIRNGERTFPPIEAFTSDNGRLLKAVSAHHEASVQADPESIPALMARLGQKFAEQAEEVTRLQGALANVAAHALIPYTSQMAYDSARREFTVSRVERGQEFSRVLDMLTALGGKFEGSTNDGVVRMQNEYGLIVARELARRGFDFTGRDRIPALGASVAG